jgi:serine-type D-Ala-D-Ala carboxypeptidase/endopeptidase (penicillin-binding protein 4)
MRAACLLLGLSLLLPASSPAQPAAPAAAAPGPPGTSSVGPAQPASTPLRPRPRGQTAALRQDLSAVLATPLLARSHWSVLVTSLDRGDVLFEHHPGKLVLPASNMKVFTMAAAADRLGWNFRFETTLESAAPIVDGVLQGDLIVRGSGDPSIALRDDVAPRVFDEWARQLREVGVTRVAGRIVGDDDALDDVRLGQGWSWDDLAYAYSGPVTALLYNEALVRLTVRPGPVPGGPALLEVEPPADHDLNVRNLVVTGAAGSEGSLELRRALGSLDLDVVGRVPLDAVEPQTRTASVGNPTLFFANALRSALLARGIEVDGSGVGKDQLPDDELARSAPPTRVLARHISATLSEIGRTFMKVSQNLYGELLVKTMGRQAGTATTAGGQEAMRETLDRWGIPPDSYVLADGSGLSRLNFVSAEATVAVLERMYRDTRHREPFMQTLPIAGQDGTLRSRLRASWTEGRVRAKTGSIAHTRALAGYVTTRAGETLAFSIIANNFTLPAWRVERIIDLLVEILARQD